MYKWVKDILFSGDVRKVSIKMDICKKSKFVSPHFELYCSL